MVNDRAKSSIPGLGYTVTYAVGNTLLTIRGMVLVMLLAWSTKTILYFTRLRWRMGERKSAVLRERLSAFIICNPEPPHGSPSERPPRDARTFMLSTASFESFDA
jgi:hypothetical protein